MNSIIPQQDNPFQIFSKDEWSIRVIDRDGDPWFVAADVCAALDLAKVSQAVSRLDDDEKGSYFLDTLGGRQEMLIVSEPGLYNLVGRSNKPSAKEFRRWINHDVLQSIRKTGMYIAKPMTTAEMLIAQAQAYYEHEQRLTAVEQRQQDLEAQIGAHNEYMTIYAYCRREGIPSPNTKNAALYGRQCSEYSRKAGISINKITDQRYGYVNTYHESVLKAILKPPMFENGQS